MPRIHDIDVQRLTPLGRLLDSYAQRQRPRLSTISAIAHALGMMPNTAKSLLYNDHEPSAKTLRKVISRTGLPAEVVYAAIAPAVAPAIQPAIEAIAPPLVYQRTRQPGQRPQIAEHAPNTALDDAIARIRATEHPAMAEFIVQALLARAGKQDPRTYWQTRIAEEHDHDFISTLVVPTVPTAPPAARSGDTAESQADSQPAGQLS